MYTLRISDLRKKNNVTQAELADHLGVTYQAVSRWETGQTYPDIDTIVRIAGFFNISTDEVLGYDSQKKNEIINKKGTGKFWGENVEYLEKTREDLWNDDYMEFLVKKVWRIAKPVRIMDYGCGYGFLGIKLLPMLPKGSTYTGLDKSDVLINRAKEIFHDSVYNTEFICSDIYEYESDRTYDICICQAFLRHLDKPEKALEKMTKTLKSGGRIICIEVNRVFEEAGYYNSAVGYDPFTNYNAMKNRWLKEKNEGGRDYSIGIRIPSILQKMGIRDIDVRLNDRVSFISRDMTNKTYKKTLENLIDSRGYGLQDVDDKAASVKKRLSRSDAANHDIERYIQKLRFNAHALNQLDDETVMFGRGLVISTGIK